MFNKIGNILEGGVKGVLALPNALRDASDRLGTSIFGGLQEQAQEFDDLARPEAEEFYAGRAGAQAGISLIRNRFVIQTLTILGVILVIGVIFNFLVRR